MSCPPRWGTPRTEAPTDGALLARVSEALGFPLFEWQRHVGDVSLERGEDGHYTHSTVVVEVGRQNGKTALVCARLAMECLRPRAVVAYTAQDRNLARLKWEEHVEVLMSSSLASRVRQVIRGNGNEKVVFNNGARYLIVTPNRTGARGLSLDLAVLDEAFAHTSLEVLAALQPTLATRPDGQMWLLSNAGDETSLLLAHYRDAGRPTVDDPSSPVAYFEWSPRDELADYNDPDVWREAIPTLDVPHGVTMKAVRDAAATLDEETFRREWLNQWTARAMSQVIPWDAWEDLRRDDVMIGAEVVVGVDVNPDRTRAAIGVAGRTGEYEPVEVADARAGTGWVVERVAEICSRWETKVVVDAGGPAGALIPDLLAADVSVEAIGMRDYARACGAFFDAVANKRVTHLDDYRLNDAVKGAAKRQLGDAWAWARKGLTDITPLVAVTLARWGLHGPDDPEPGIW